MLLVHFLIFYGVILFFFRHLLDKDIKRDKIKSKDVQDALESRNVHNMDLGRR